MIKTKPSSETIEFEGESKVKVKVRGENETAEHKNCSTLTQGTLCNIRFKQNISKNIKLKIIFFKRKNHSTKK